MLLQKKRAAKQHQDRSAWFPGCRGGDDCRKQLAHPHGDQRSGGSKQGNQEIGGCAHSDFFDSVSDSDHNIVQIGGEGKQKGTEKMHGLFLPCAKALLSYAGSAKGVTA